MENIVMNYDEFVNESRNIKLGKENQAAADAVVAFLKENPGSNQSDVYRFINSKKAVLKNYKDPMHYKNYENIIDWLVGQKLIRSEKTGKLRLYFAIY